MRTRLPALLGAPLVLALLPWLPQDPAVPEAREIRPYVGLWGADSKIVRPRQLRITSTDALRGVWLEHLGVEPERYSPYYNVPQIPDVDFDACMVVAIFQGESVNTAGVRVVSIDAGASRLRVRFEDRSYQTSGPDGGAQRACAYGFFVVPRSARGVVFEENVQGRIGRAPKWKERARLPALR